MEDLVSPTAPRPTETRRVRLATGIDVLLDARRAIVLPSERTLALADLHLGYSWVQRRRGALMPLTTPETTASRVAALLGDHQPQHLVILGDLVHQATQQPGVEEALDQLARAIPPEVTWTVCTGNHDRNLGRLLERLPRSVQLVSSVSMGGCLLHHGDTAPVRNPPETFSLEGSEAFQIIGHEHPALRLGDGVATEAKVPCFMVSREVLVVPAFSDWAAGCDIQRGTFLGPIANGTRFHTAHACMGPRLLEIPLNPVPPPDRR